MAVVVDSLDEVRDYFEENGADIAEMTDDELEEASEVFPVSGRTLSCCRRIKRSKPRFYLTVAFFNASSIAFMMTCEV